MHEKGDLENEIWRGGGILGEVIGLLGYLGSTCCMVRKKTQPNLPANFHFFIWQYLIGFFKPVKFLLHPNNLTTHNLITPFLKLPAP